MEATTPSLQDRHPAAFIPGTGDGDRADRKAFAVICHLGRGKRE
jgi:hypothetical protein